MMTFITVLHILVAIVLISLVLLQDSKSNGALGMGGSNSNSLLGATGAQTLASKATMWAAVLFAATCLGLTYYTSSGSRSVVDTLPLPTAPASAPTQSEGSAAPAAPAGSPAETAPAAAQPATESSSQ